MRKTKDSKIFLAHILESIGEIEKNIAGMTADQFLKSVTIQDAVNRRVEIIGEAVKNLPNSFKIKHKEIPWKQIAGMRDILIHEYFGVDNDLVWKIATKDIPKLKEQISEILEEKTQSVKTKKLF